MKYDRESMFPPGYTPTPIEKVQIQMPSQRLAGFAFIGVVVTILMIYAIALFG